MVPAQRAWSATREWPQAGLARAHALVPRAGTVQIFLEHLCYTKRLPRIFCHLRPEAKALAPSALAAECVL